MHDVRRLPVGEGDEEITIALDELAREGARRMIAAALRAEADAYVERFGEDAAGLSATTIARMCKEWEEHHDRFRNRHLGFSRYAYLFMDGIHVSVRLGEDPKVCLLIVIGVREDGEKELLAVEDGYRESTESWAGVFRDMKRRGLNEPRLVVGDGALGAWAALRDVYPAAGEQRCWFHASGNIIDCLPKRLQPRR